MSSGQKLLADLLGLTNAATKSISDPKLSLQDENSERNAKTLKNKNSALEEISAKQKNMQFNESYNYSNQESNDPSELGKADGKVVTNKIEDFQLIDKNSQLHNKDANLMAESPGDGKIEDLSDADYHVADILVGKKTEQQGVVVVCDSESSQTNSEYGSKPVPGASDLLKAGVFVSSCSGVLHSTVITTSPDKGKVDQAVSRRTEPEFVKTPAVLTQGSFDPGRNDQIATKESEVVAVKYPQGQKRDIVQEKLKSRMQSKGAVRKTVHPNIIHKEIVSTATVKAPSEREGHAHSVAVADAASTSAAATSAAIAPFLQIQNALEGQIESLVNAINQAHSAKGKIEYSGQQNQLKELERTLLNELDKRMSRLEKAQMNPMKEQANGLNKKEEHLPPNTYPSSLNRYLPMEGLPGFTDVHRNDLQIIPTRDKGLTNDNRSSHNALSKLTNQITRNSQQLSNASNEPIKDNQSEMRRAMTKQPPHEAYKMDKHSQSVNKGSSHQHSALNSKFLELYNKNVETQTSSAESSLLSEKSLLATPLPRSKIPVPFAKYTPKHALSRQKYGKVAKKKSTFHLSKMDHDVLKNQLRGEKQLLFSDKENSSPKSSSPTVNNTKERWAYDRNRSSDRQ